MLTDLAARLGRAGGLTYLDLLCRRDQGELAVPDAVLLPASPEQVQLVIEACVRHDIGVVPFGGGTSGSRSSVRGAVTSCIRPRAHRPEPQQAALLVADRGGFGSCSAFSCPTRTPAVLACRPGAV
jgi:hypothetical protein